MHVSKKCLKCKISINNAAEREKKEKKKKRKENYPFSFFGAMPYIPSSRVVVPC